jgi:hypothetical protein
LLPKRRFDIRRVDLGQRVETRVSGIDNQLTINGGRHGSRNIAFAFGCATSNRNSARAFLALERDDVKLNRIICVIRLQVFVLASNFMPSSDSK